MSYAYYKTSSRGFGYSSRGSYRGRGGDSYYSRGSYRGRSNWQTEPSGAGFESRSRYASGTTSRGQGEDSGYRRYGREEELDYGSHDRSYDSSRKRMRTDHGYSQASSAHRSHEGGYDGGVDYNSRYGYSGDKESYGYREERRPTTSFRERTREEYSHRKQEPLQVSTPYSSASRYPSSRGSFRGRIRGYRGAMSKMSYLRRTGSVFARKRSMMDPNAIRKRILSSRSQADTLRRLKLLKLRRLREVALRKAEIGKKGKADGDTKTTEDVSDEEDEDEDEDNEKEEDENEGEEKKVPKKKVKAKKEIKKEDGEEGEDKEADEDEEGEEDEDEEDDDDKENAETPSKGAKSKDGDDTLARSTLFRGRPFIKLNCPHCYSRCLTFRDYNTHLYSFKHLNAVRKLWQLHKSVLMQLRVKQRRRQRIIDTQKGEEDGTLKTKYCVICKLNYSELKAEHIASEYHKKILDYMKPYCKVCQFKLSSPMLYEKHVCSLDHIKRKALLAGKAEGKGNKSKDSGSGEDEEKELDLDNFMTLDSVGTFDGEEGKKEGEEKPKEEKKVTQVNLGDEHIKKVNVQYCELCRMYLSRTERANAEKAVIAHCRSRTHLTFYMRHCRRLERIEAEERRKKLLAKKAAKAEKEGNKEEKMDVDKDGDTKPSENDAEDASKAKSGKAAGEIDQDLETDEKMWADVDKDLGDILREVEPDAKSSDEDEDGTEGGRYDRFKYSEKGTAVEDAGDTPKEAEAQPEKMESDPAVTEETPETKSPTTSPAKKSAPAAAAVTAASK